jgi:hypothetical protein
VRICVACLLHLNGGCTGRGQVRRLSYSSDGYWTQTNYIDQVPGGGPARVLVWRSSTPAFIEGGRSTDESPTLSLSFPDGVLFTLNRFTNTVTAQVLNGTTNLIQSLSIAPGYPPTLAGAKCLAGELLTPPPNKKYPEGLLFASNRNFGVEDPRGDSIAIIEYLPWMERLDIVNMVFTGLQQIRGMAFSSDGEFLVVCSAKSGGVKALGRTKGGADL